MPSGLSTDDLWRPVAGGALPAGPVLRAMADRCGAAWGEADLASTVTVGYSGRLRTSLGRAFPAEARVELNPRLLGEHPDELIPTLVHELAHVVVYRRYGRVAPHGEQFRTLMRAVNLSAAATHDVPVESLRRPRRRYLYLHRCPTCGQSFIARKVYRRRRCGACPAGSAFEVFRAPATAEGRKVLEAQRS